MPHLEDLNVLELSPVLSPANRRRKVFQKSQQESEMPFPGLLEYVEKSSMSAAAKAACNAGFEQFKKAKDEMPAEAWAALKKAFGMMDEEQSAKLAKADEEIEKSAKLEGELSSVREAVKRSVQSLDAAEPAVRPALDVLAQLVGHTPVHQQIEMSPAVKAYFDAVQKSAAEDKAKLAALEKSVEESRALARRAEISKSAAEIKGLPVESAGLSDLLYRAHVADAKLGSDVQALLEKTAALVQKSAAMGEIGSQMRGEGGALAKVRSIAKSMVEKSATGITQAQAEAQAWNDNPELYAQYQAEMGR